MGRKVFRNYYKGHVDKTKGEGGSKGGGGLGWGGGEKMQTTVIEQQQIIFKKDSNCSTRFVHSNTPKPHLPPMFCFPEATTFFILIKIFKIYF